MSERIPFSSEPPQPQGKQVADWWRKSLPRPPEDALYALAHMKAERDELLEALEWAERALAPFSKEPAEKSGMAKIRAAIAKARGEDQ